MKTSIHILFASLLSISLAGCLDMAKVSNDSQNSVLVSQVVSVCGALVGDQAEQRINQEWSKYPEANANRNIIETMAEVLLNDPTATEAQSTSNYKKYLSCATGLLVTNGLVK
ncbi:MAG: hypothetical protein OQK98_15925 [Gammaproteobacteria bacterium]|nr:hypothetical protein [Gammaproteobacteria bacterium]